MGLNIGVTGIGGVGGYFGGKLSRLVQSGKANVYFVARGKHLDAIRTNGLSVRTVSEGDWICRPTIATDRIEDLPPLDICFICVKSYDLTTTAMRLRDRIFGGTTIVPLLNGIDIYERLRRSISAGRVYPACVYIGASVEGPGRIAQTGGPCRMLFGRDPWEKPSDPAGLVELLGSCGVNHTWYEDVYPEIWRKYLFIASFGLVNASHNRTFGKILASASLTDTVVSVMGEIVSLSRKKGIVLPGNIVAEMLAQASEYPPDAKTSIQRDVEPLDKPDERDLYAGTILSLGKQLGIETPVTRSLSEILERRKRPINVSHPPAPRP